MITIMEGKQFLRERWEDGAECPCCKQRVHLKPYPMHISMAKCLIILFENRGKWIHMENELVKRGSKIKGVVGKLKYWGLVEQQKNENGRKNKSGMWRITGKGNDFVTGMITVPSIMRVYMDKDYRSEGKQITISDALKHPFDYREVMNG